MGPGNSTEDEEEERVQVVSEVQGASKVLQQTILL